MKKKILALVLSVAVIVMMLPAAASAEEPSFTDIGGHWAEDIIETWAGRGVVNGTGNGLFEPDKGLTRAELCKIIYEILDLPVPAEGAALEDVPEDAWYADAVAACLAVGMVDDYGNGSFGPTDFATREQCMKGLCGVFGIDPLDDLSVLDQFEDKDSVSPWAAGYVAAMVKAGLVSGTSVGIEPSAGIDRASFLALLANIISDFVNEAGTYRLKDMNADGVVLVTATDVKLLGTLKKGGVVVITQSGKYQLNVSGTTRVTQDDTTLTNLPEGARVIVPEGVTGTRVNGTRVREDTVYTIPYEDDDDGGYVPSSTPPASTDPPATPTSYA